MRIPGSSYHTDSSNLCDEADRLSYIVCDQERRTPAGRSTARGGEKALTRRRTRSIGQTGYTDRVSFHGLVAEY